MRKYLMLFAVLYSLFGCKPAAFPQPDSQMDNKLQVVATTTIVADIVKEIGGEHITLTTLMPYSADPHSFEPTPQDMFRVAEAEFVFINGAGLETFLDNLLENAGASEKVVDLSDGIQPRSFENEHEEIIDEQHSGSSDPHIWTDPNNILVWVEHIEKMLVKSDPAHEQIYRENAEKYRYELASLDAWIREQVDQVPDSERKLVTDHLIFGYYSDRYGFEQIASIIPGFSTLGEPSVSQLAQIEEQIRTLGIKAVFVGHTSNPDLALRISEDLNVQLVFLYTGSLSKPGEEADTYLQYMRYNTNAIVNALK